MEIGRGVMGGLRIGNAGGKAPEIMAVILADFAEGVLRTGRAIAVAHVRGQRGIQLHGFPGVFDPNLFANTTLNYHILPAFLQQTLCLCREHYPCQALRPNKDLI